MIENRAVPRSLSEVSVVETSSQFLPSLYIPGQGTSASRTQNPPAKEPSRDVWITGEPVLQDLLEDPLIHAVLQRDGLDRQDLLQAIALGRRRLIPASRPGSASDAA